MPLSPGLYLVATPIGNAEDITLRALRILREADMLAAEDTRTLRRLMDIHGVPVAGRPMLAYHDHNGAEVRPRLMAMLAEGRSVAYASDAGTPLIADPGYRLAVEATTAGIPVTTAPGASAVLAALGIAGLPTDRFLFAGFLPPKRAARLSALVELAAVPATLVVFESPRRVGAALADMAEVLGDRSAAVCRELTKKFEEARRGTLAALADTYSDDSPKGEVVVVIGPPSETGGDAGQLDELLARALADNSVRDAAALVAEALSLPRKQVYARALELSGR